MARGGGLDNPEMGQAAFKLEVKKGEAGPVDKLWKTKKGRRETQTEPDLDL
jgi:hypothetical protein